MKKNWLRLLFAALLCAMLLLIIPTALAYGAYCETCQQYREMDFDYYEELGFGSRRVHYPVYRCPVCKVAYRDYQQSAEHAGGTATCKELAVCSTCGKKYGNYGPHVGGKATCTVYAVCDVCYHIYGDRTAHTGGTATCLKPAKCTACQQEYGDLGPHTGGTATCTKLAICDVCQQEYGGLKPHTGGKATCTTHSVCDVCHQEYGFFASHQLQLVETQPATCQAEGWTEYQYCTVCDFVSSHQVLPKLEHDLEHHEAKAPTATEKGWEAYDTCKREGCDYSTYVELPPLGHNLMQEGNPNSGLPHQEAQASTGTEPGETCAVACESVELPALNISLCPVCGTVNDGSKLALTNASVKIVSGKIPHGEAILRVGTLASGEKLLTVGYVYGGQLSKASCQVKITLPAELVNGYTLSLLNADGTETPVDCTVDGESAVFTLTFAQPTLAVRLVPAQ